jgi:hypothetical protein
MNRNWIQVLVAVGILYFIVLLLSVSFYVFLKEQYYANIPLNEITVTHKKRPLSGTVEYARKICLDNHKFGKLKILIDCQNRAMYRTDM